MTQVEMENRRLIKLPRVLGPVAAFCVVVGSVIGSGIFLVPATVAQNVPYISGIVLVWVIGGLFSGAGALDARRAGCDAAACRRACTSFSAWPMERCRRFCLAGSSFSSFVRGRWRRWRRRSRVISLDLYRRRHGFATSSGRPAAATVAIAVVTLVNVMGTRWGGTLQIFGTVLKVGGVTVLIALPFLLGGGTVANLSPMWPSALGGSIFTGMMTAMIGVLWAYDGWTNVTPLAEEIRDPGRNVPRALIWGMAVLIAVYLSMTLAYHYVLPMTEVASASSKDVQQCRRRGLLRRLLGWPGVVAISLLVMCSTFISFNGNALTGPRAYFAMARDGLFPAGLCRVSDRFQTPANAVLRRASGRLSLTLAGTLLIVVSPTVAPGLPSLLLAAWKKLNETPLYDVLYTYVIFGANLFYMLAISSVFVLRVRLPDLAAAISHLGLSDYPDCSTSRRRSCSWETCWRTIRAGFNRWRASASSYWVCRPTGCFEQTLPPSIWRANNR